MEISFRLTVVDTNTRVEYRVGEAAEWDELGVYPTMGHAAEACAEKIVEQHLRDTGLL